jgi:hypothetical protein
MFIFVIFGVIAGGLSLLIKITDSIMNCRKKKKERAKANKTGNLIFDTTSSILFE